MPNLSMACGLNSEKNKRRKLVIYFYAGKGGIVEGRPLIIALLSLRIIYECSLKFRKSSNLSLGMAADRIWPLISLTSSIKFNFGKQVGERLLVSCQFCNWNIFDLPINTLNVRRFL